MYEIFKLLSIQKTKRIYTLLKSINWTINQKYEYIVVKK